MTTLGTSLHFANLMFRVPGKGQVRVEGKIEARERVALRGPSGCGKTTFLRVLSRLYPFEGGKFFSGDRDLSGLEPDQTGAGLVFQSGALLPHLGVLENVVFGIKFQAATRDWSRDMILDRGRDYLRKVGMSELADRSVSNLSGGEKQRVALARTLILSPDYLLLDEPLSSVDSERREELQEWILSLWHERPIPLIIVTHDLGEAKKLSSREVNWSDECLRF